MTGKSEKNQHNIQVTEINKMRKKIAQLEETIVPEISTTREKRILVMDDEHFLRDIAKETMKELKQVPES